MRVFEHKALRRRTWIVGLCFSATLAACVQADVVVLTDGSTLTGQVRQTENGYEVKLADGSIKVLGKDKVKSVSIDSAIVSEEAAVDRLASLRRSVEFDSDLKKIVQKFESFVKINAPTRAASEAQTDIDLWRDRLAKKMTRVGTNWVTQAQRVEILKKSRASVEQVMGLIASNDINGASRQLQEATKLDPDNVSFAYLLGVIESSIEAWPRARASFESVSQKVPSHPPTLNNLAAISARFKRWAQALSQLDQAIVAVPNSSELLDNAAELLQMLPDSQRRGPVYARLARNFAEQDQKMQQSSAIEGRFRWGSTWVNQAKLDMIKAEQEGFEKKQADLESQYRTVNQNIDRNKSMIESNLQSMRRMDADAVYRNTDGLLIRRPVPDVYWEMKRDNDRMNLEMNDLDDRQRDLKKQAADLMTKVPSPPFSGFLRLIGAEGVPVLDLEPLPDSPSTMPSP